MIVIVEGIDRTGKTELCKYLAEQGFIYLKDTSPRGITQDVEKANNFVNNNKPLL
jgi:thymidylate kinase